MHVWILMCDLLRLLSMQDLESFVYRNGRDLITVFALLGQMNSFAFCAHGQAHTYEQPCSNVCFNGMLWLTQQSLHLKWNKQHSTAILWWGSLESTNISLVYVRSEYKLCINEKHTQRNSSHRKEQELLKVIWIGDAILLEYTAEYWLHIFHFLYFHRNKLHFQKQAKIIFSCDYMSNRKGMKVYTF